MKKLGIHIFRRDLRIQDNTALNFLFKVVDEVLPIFIFDDRQVKEHPFKSAPGLQMLCESLIDLDKELVAKGSALYVQSGVAEKVIEKLIADFSPTAISYNKDYTPFSMSRDRAIDSVCVSKGVKVIAEHDVTLHAPGTVLTKEGKPYSIYTHYRVAVEQMDMRQSARLPASAVFATRDGGEKLSDKVATLVPRPIDLRVKGGRVVAKQMIKKLNKSNGYSEQRDFPAIDATSFLSAHIKFGTLSIREIFVYAKTHMPNSVTFLREILWHDFFTTVAALTPHVYKGAYRKEFDALKWSDDEKAFEKWKEGKTGFPIVDAGMRELNATGYMHNRVRMIVASFLIKDLHINWQWGEKYFAQRLTDYDPAVNNGNWQWVAGTGCDASPWFRIFNPWLQQAKFDAGCEYIKKWIPELEGLSLKEIHDIEGIERAAVGYPVPMCDHKKEAEKTKELYSAI